MKKSENLFTVGLRKNGREVSYLEIYGTSMNAVRRKIIAKLRRENEATLWEITSIKEEKLNQLVMGL
jgi:hypothetical protein